MAIPDFQTIMLPLLKITGDEEKHRHSDVSAALAAQFNLTEAEIKEGSSLNCVGWTAWRYQTQISFVPLCLCGNPSHTDHHKGTKSQRPHESLHSPIGNSEEPKKKGA